MTHDEQVKRLHDRIKKYRRQQVTDTLVNRFNTPMGWWLAAVCCVVGVILAGFGESVTEVESCRISITKYHLAHYSEAEVSVSMDGTPSVSTDYWTEVISDKNIAMTVDTIVGVTGYHDVDYPERYSDYETENLDRITLEKDVKFDIFTTDGRVGGEPSEWKTCVESVGSYVETKTWFGLTYNIKLNVAERFMF